MLIIARKKADVIRLTVPEGLAAGATIDVKILEIVRRRVRLGFDCPREIQIETIQKDGVAVAELAPSKARES